MLKQPANKCSSLKCKAGNQHVECAKVCHALQVYKGILHGSTPVAIKFITRQTYKEKLRFVSEIHILKNLRHVNVRRSCLQSLPSPLLARLWPSARHGRAPTLSMCNLIKHDDLRVDGLRHSGKPAPRIMPSSCSTVQTASISGQSVYIDLSSDSDLYLL